jgi:hypothetical protein
VLKDIGFRLVAGYRLQSRAGSLFYQVIVNVWQPCEADYGDDNGTIFATEAPRKRG